MKTLDLTPMAVVKAESEATVKKIMKTAKKGLSKTFKFLMYISPVYPQCTQVK